MSKKLSVQPLTCYKTNKFVCTTKSYKKYLIQCDSYDLLGAKTLIYYNKNILWELLQDRVAHLNCALQIKLLNEQMHDETNKWPVRPAKTQLSLGIRPVWSESSLGAWRNLGALASHLAHSEDSDQSGRMPRLISLCWAHMSFCWFCHAAAQIILWELLVLWWAL